MKTVHGITNGKRIELRDDPGLPQGQDGRTSQWGDGLRRCAGALEWTEEDDRILAEILEERRR